MPWILFLLAFGCFAALCLTKSFALGVLCMLLALVFVVAATLQLLSARIGNATRHVNILSPEELRVLREQAQVERVAMSREPLRGWAFDHFDHSSQRR